MLELLIYTPQVTPRVSYIFDLIFGSIIHTPYTITTDVEAFKTYTGPKLNYSADSFEGNKLQIVPCGLLNETGVNVHRIEVSAWNGLKIFFRTDEGSMPFDVFSASFYLVSRYEEYSLYSLDKHKRFKHRNSLAYKNNFLDDPLINLWAAELEKIICAEYLAISFTKTSYSFIPTLDIDVAYSYLGKSLLVTIGAYFKSLFQLKLKTVFEKSLVLLYLKRDPYDTYKFQESIFTKYKLHPLYFFLAGKRGKYDRNISPGSRWFKRLLRRLSKFSKAGIHPSYGSASQANIVLEEIKNIEKNIGSKITSSRQHFLRLKLPETYQCLVDLGIKDDYTMAYAGAAGFRASICTPFLFYDLKAERVLPVRLHSSAIMDGTLNEYLKLSPESAISVVTEIISKTKNAGGEFIPIWHNHSLNERGHWKGWRIVFEKMIEAAV